MEKIAVKNYRAISDSGDIDILPITAVVGKNSAGKSSFLRIFPLIKQTLETKTADSILWYGDYVDLGDYENAVSKSNKNNPIEFSFSLKYFRPRNSRGRNFFKKNTLINITISIREKFIEKINITIEDQKIEIDMCDDGKVNTISINEDENILGNKNFIWRRDMRGLLPTLFEQIKANDYDNRYYNRFDIELKKKCEKLIVTNKTKETYSSLYYVVDEIDLGSKEHILSVMKKINKDKFEKYKIEYKKFIKINNYIIASKLNGILDEINNLIITDMERTQYVKPIRALVDRYYRVQGISIDKLDADGSNLPMILYNMSPDNLKKFEEWSEEKFGVIFSVTKSLGHASLIVKDGDEEMNLADTGYGYSQMLPIVVLLWTIHTEKISYINMPLSKTIVIEQPELHLHPAYQAKMIDVFVNVVKEARDKRIDLKILFETHSETMINRLGKLIRTNKIDSSLVNILIFDKDKDITTVSSKQFNAKGLLRGWPIGFFAPDEV